jgi:BirA family biotin operon repressor/biotin-[acetyl-CoA-carboxylase] ligase
MTTPNIPPAYNLREYETVDSAIEEARRLAIEGAEEGTLVWTRNQSAGQGRLGRPWVSEPGNLYCAVIFRPEDPPAVATQLIYVTAIALWAAMAACVSPLTELHYRWPNDILLLDDKVAGLMLARAPREFDNWMVVGIAVNVVNHPVELGSPASSMGPDGGSEVSNVKLLELFSRHLLNWLNRWSDEGFEPIRKAWIQRAKGVGERLEVVLNDETVEGVFIELDDNGAMVMELSDGTRRKILLTEFFSITHDPAAT